MSHVDRTLSGRVEVRTIEAGRTRLTRHSSLCRTFKSGRAWLTCRKTLPNTFEHTDGRRGRSVQRFHSAGHGNRDTGGHHRLERLRQAAPFVADGNGHAARKRRIEERAAGMRGTSSSPVAQVTKMPDRAAGNDSQRRLIKSRRPWADADPDSSSGSSKSGGGARADRESGRSPPLFQQHKGNRGGPPNPRYSKANKIAPFTIEVDERDEVLCARPGHFLDKLRECGLVDADGKAMPGAEDVMAGELSLAITLRSCRAWGRQAGAVHSTVLVRW